MAVILLDSTSTSFQAPFDWSNTNTMHIVGGGAGGIGGFEILGTNAISGCGGGGGGYSKFTNITTYTAGTVYPVNIAATTAQVTPSGTNSVVGNSADITYIDDGNYSTISYVAGSQTQVTVAAQVMTISTPTGTANGDLLIAIVSAGGKCAGWTLLYAASSFQLLYKYAQSEPATQSFNAVTTGTGTGTPLGIISCFRGAIIDVNSASAFGTTTIIIPSVTASKSNSYSVIPLMQSTGTGGSYTTPTGYTAGQSNYDATAPAGAIFYKSGIAAGATGTVSVTSAVTPSGTSYGLQLILSPKPSKFAQGGNAGFANSFIPLVVSGKGGYGLTFSGGAGGLGTTGTTSSSGGGGGGAGGSTAAGNAGTNGVVSAPTVGTNGGQGDGTTGGAGGSGAAGVVSNGSNGTELASPYGSGGGGAGGGGNPYAGGTGGLYGGGGGGGGVGASTYSSGGTGAEGAIIISYTGATIVQANQFFEMF